MKNERGGKGSSKKRNAGKNWAHRVYNWTYPLRDKGIRVPQENASFVYGDKPYGAFSDIIRRQGSLGKVGGSTVIFSVRERRYGRGERDLCASGGKADTEKTGKGKGKWQKPGKF